MNITAKSRYAFRLMMDLAHHEGGIQSRQDIAKRQGIPLDFMDHILLRLRKSELIRTLRGRSGGVQLARASESITMWDIVTSVEDMIYPVQCVTSTACGAEMHCMSHDMWVEMFDVFRESLAKNTLGVMLKRWQERCGSDLAPNDGFSAKMDCKPLFSSV